MRIIANNVPIKSTANSEDTKTKNQVSSIPNCPFLGSSIYSMLLSEKPLTAGSQMKAAKHGWLWLLPGRAAWELLGSKKLGNGGGGMFKIMLGGAPKLLQSLQPIFWAEILIIYQIWPVLNLRFHKYRVEIILKPMIKMGHRIFIWTFFLSFKKWPNFVNKLA